METMKSQQERNRQNLIELICFLFIATIVMAIMYI